MAICLAFILISCASLEEKDESMLNIYKPKDGEVVAYLISKKDFQEFLLRPNENSFHEKVFLVFRKSDIREGYIKLEVFGHDHDIKSENEGGLIRIGEWPVYSWFVDFMNEKENFKQILAENDIQEELLSYVIIEHEFIVLEEGELLPPQAWEQMCIWLHTDAGDYFLENDPYKGSANGTKFFYKFYDLEEYSQKYGGS